MDYLDVILPLVFALLLVPLVFYVYWLRAVINMLNKEEGVKYFGLIRDPNLITQLRTRSAEFDDAWKKCMRYFYTTILLWGGLFLIGVTFVLVLGEEPN